MKIFQIKNQSEKFLNLDSKDAFYTSVFWRASYFSSAKIATQIIQSSGVSGLVVSETTELEFTEAVATATTNVSIQMDSLASRLESYAYSIPTMSKLNKTLKTFVVNTSLKLKAMNPQFKEFLDQKEDDTFDVLSLYDDYIETISPLEFWEMKDITHLVKMYRKDKKSIMGMADKIQKY